MHIHSDLSKLAAVKYRDATWRPSPLKGVDRLMLERIGGEKVQRATSIVTYQPGSRFSEHIHDGGEEFLVLDGVFSDSTGDFGPGTYVRNPVGSRHAPWSKPGTTIFVKLAQFDAADQELVRLDTEAATWLSESGEGIEELPLHQFGAEQVSLMRLRPKADLSELDTSGGIEIFVVRGGLETSAGSLRERDWLRLPPGTPLTLSSTDGATLYIKTGHLVTQQTSATYGESHDHAF